MTAPATEERIPFGKHKGTAFYELPTEYLLWLYHQEWLSDRIHNFVCHELGLRNAITEERRFALACELIAAGRRSLAVKHHPDKGGTPEMMRDINSVADSLLEAVRASRI